MKNERFKAGMAIFWILAALQTAQAIKNTPKSGKLPETEHVPAGPRIFGSDFDDTALLEITSLLQNPSHHTGRTVVTRGRISAIDPNGTWLHLVSDEKTINVVILSADWALSEECIGQILVVQGVFNCNVIKDADLERFIEQHGGSLSKRNYPDGLTFYEIEVQSGKLPEPGKK